jgi:hypothetical protein
MIMRFKEWMMLNEGMLEIPAKVDRQLRKFWIEFTKKFVERRAKLKDDKKDYSLPREMQFSAWFIPSFSGTKYEYLNELPENMRKVHIDGASTANPDYLGTYQDSGGNSLSPNRIVIQLPRSTQPAILQQYLSTLRHEFLHHIQYLIKAHVRRTVGRTVDAGGGKRGANTEIMRSKYVNFEGSPSLVYDIVQSKFKHVHGKVVNFFVENLFGYIMLWQKFKISMGDEVGSYLGEFKNYRDILNPEFRKFVRDYFSEENRDDRFISVRDANEGGIKGKDGRWYLVEMDVANMNDLIKDFDKHKELMGDRKFRRGDLNDMIRLMVDIASKFSNPATFPDPQDMRINHQLRPVEYQTNLSSDFNDLMTQYLSGVFSMLRDNEKFDDKDFHSKSGQLKILRVFIDQIKKYDDQASKPVKIDKRPFKKMLFDSYMRYRYPKRTLARESPQIHKWVTNKLYDKFINRKTKIKDILDYMLSLNASVYDFHLPNDNPAEKFQRGFKGSRLSPKYGMVTWQ